MAWQSLREHGALKVEANADPRSARQVLVDGILINVLNPKLSIFFVAFLPQFIAPNEANVLGRMLELSGVFMLATFVIFAIYGLCAAAVRDKVTGSPRFMTWMRRTFAAAFVMLGAKLALTER
jgi:threonine/homoserine/homoserine lactone efflux protein